MRSVVLGFVDGAEPRTGGRESLSRRDRDFCFQFLSRGLGPTERSALGNQSEPGALCSVGNDLWRRRADHLRAPNGQADFLRDRRRIAAMHRVAGYLPVAELRLLDTSTLVIGEG